MTLYEAHFKSMTPTPDKEHETPPPHHHKISLAVGTLKNIFSCLSSVNNALIFQNEMIKLYGAHV